MKKSKTIFLAISLFCVCNASYASWWTSIFKSLLRLEGINTDIFNLMQDEGSQLSDIDSLVKQLNKSMVGNSGWGTYNFHDYQSYGSSASNWNSVLQVSSQGGGSGELANQIRSNAKQFPINSTVFNKGISDGYSQQYYALKSQTVLATRAASELDYNKVQEQISYQQMLQRQIERTANLKAAVDLLNRIQVEGNLINLEILRQVALSNQQQSVTEQASVNSALFNANFLLKK